MRPELRRFKSADDTTLGIWLSVSPHPVRMSKSMYPVRDEGCKPEALLFRRIHLVARAYHAEVPPRVEYRSTPLAGSLLPAFHVLAGWTDEHLDEVDAARRRFDAQSR